MGEGIPVGVGVGFRVEDTVGVCKAVDPDEHPLTKQTKPKQPTIWNSCRKPMRLSEAQNARIICQLPRIASKPIKRRSRRMDAVYHCDPVTANHNAKGGKSF